MATRETRGVMGYKDEKGDLNIHYPVTEAELTTYDPKKSGLSANNAQEAVDELAEGVAGTNARARSIEIALNGSKTLTGSKDPTTETPGKVSQHYINTETEQEFECVAAEDGTYTWEPVEEGTSLRATIEAAKKAADDAKKGLDDFKQEVEEGGGLGSGSGGGNVIKITFEEAFVGKQYTVTDGDDTKTGTVPEGRIVNVAVVNCNSTYTIKAKADNGVEYSTSVETGPYYGQYTATLSVFNATIKVTAAPEAEVKATREGESFSATAGGDGVAEVSVNQTGSYSITATKEGASSDSTSVEVTEETTYEATVNFITMTVTADPGSYLTLTNGSTIKTGTTAGASTFYLPNTGEWVVTATLSGQTAMETVNVNAYRAFSVTLTYYKTVTVHVAEAGNTNPETAVTYADDAVGMSAGYDAWKDHPIYKKIRPCVVKDGVVQYYLNRDNMTQKEDGSAATINSTSAGDVMIEIPKLGYKMTTDGSDHIISVTDDPNAEGYCYRAHSLDNEGDCDKIYIGAYLGFVENDKLYSISGKTPPTKSTIKSFQTCVQARGMGYQLLSFYPLTLLQCLYLIMFKDRNGQAALGRGFVDGNSDVAITGGSNSQPFCYGETTGKKQMKFIGIEDFWGNLFQIVEGVGLDSNRDIKTAFKDFNNDGTNYPYFHTSNLSGNITGNFVSKIQGTNEGGFIVKEVNGSATTGWADSIQLYANSPVGFFGGNWNIGDRAGPFQLYLFSALTGTIYGARLIYKHKEEAA